MGLEEGDGQPRCTLLLAGLVIIVVSCYRMPKFVADAYGLVVFYYCTPLQVAITFGFS